MTTFLWSREAGVSWSQMSWVERTWFALGGQERDGKRLVADATTHEHCESLASFLAFGLYCQIENSQADTVQTSSSVSLCVWANPVEISFALVWHLDMQQYHAISEYHLHLHMLPISFNVEIVWKCDINCRMRRLAERQLAPAADMWHITKRPKYN